MFEHANVQKTYGIPNPGSSIMGAAIARLDDHGNGRALGVPMEFERLDGSINALGGVIEDLTRRLESLLLPSEPSTTGKDSAPMPRRCSVAIDVGRAAERIQCLTMAVRVMIERLDV